MPTTPDRFVVVDGNVYWIEHGPAVAQPGGGRAIHWTPLAILMHAPMTVSGQIAWAEAGYVEAAEPAQTDAIIAALTETYTGISLAHEVA